jgi:hypothetical protein
MLFNWNKTMNKENPIQIQKSAEALFRKLRKASLFLIVLSIAFLGFGVGFEWNYILTICLVVGCNIIAFVLPYTVRRIKIKRDMELVKLMHIQDGYRGQQ